MPVETTSIDSYRRGFGQLWNRNQEEELAKVYEWERRQVHALRAWTWRFARANTAIMGRPAPQMTLMIFDRVP